MSDARLAGTRTGAQRVPRRRRGQVWRLARRPALALSLLTLFLVTLCVLSPGLFTATNPYAINMDARLHPPGRQSWFGTDDFGRDLLSRVVYGARLSLGGTLIVIAVAACIGTVLGAIAGFVGGYVDDVIMRACDLMISLPLFIMAMAIVTVIGRGIASAIIAGIIVWWAQYARLVRGSVLSIIKRTYVEAARAAGASSSRILTRHVLPNSIAPAIVKASLDVGQVLLVITGLSFLGLGAQPPAAEWGAMVTVGRKFLFDAWWYPTMPGLAIFVTSLSFNLVGDELVMFLNPQLRSSIRRFRA
jgi:peptide/nickel transport system permease protein